MLIAPVGLLFVIFTFLPIYYDLKHASTFQYLELRYESKVPKILANVLSLVFSLLYSGVVLFAPASALETFIGIPTIYNIMIMAFICTIYTSIGGIRAVIWTDVFQAAVMLAGLVVILVVGSMQIGMDSIWYELEKHGHTHLNFSFDISERGSVFIFTFCYAFQKYSVYCNQPTMVRYTALPTIKQAKISILIGACGFVLIQGLPLLVGIVVFTYYSKLGCGPMGSGEIYSPNQIIPYFVIDVINVPGITGLFISAIVASSLSTISSAQNSFGTVFWKDILCEVLPEMSDFKKTVLLKIITLVFGVLCVFVALGAMHYGGTIIVAANMVIGIVVGPPLGMFILGGCTTFVSAKSSVIGCICSLVFCVWISVGKALHGTLWESPIVLNEFCFNVTQYDNYTIPASNNPNITSIFAADTVDLQHNLFVMKLYSISPFAYIFVGCTITTIIALMLSIIPWFRHKNDVDQALLFPFIRRFVKRKNMYVEKDSTETNKFEKSVL